MSTITTTVTQTNEKKIKNKDKALKTATTSNDLDTVLDKVKKIDNTCSFLKCRTKVADFSIHCKYCNNHFCTTHGLPEIHGCGEAVRRDERRKFEHPGGEKLSKEKHSQAQTKLSMKLKQMQNERKSKQTTQNKGKK